MEQYEFIETVPSDCCYNTGYPSALLRVRQRFSGAGTIYYARSFADNVFYYTGL